MSDNSEKKIDDFTAVGSVAGSIADDFSNWLGIISGYAISITDNLIPNTRAHEDALRILEATRHAEALTKRLRSISKASSSSLETEAKVMNVAHAIEEAVALAEETLSDQKIKIKVKDNPATLLITAEYSQFIDCLMHIFFNSVEAMSNGGTIAIDTSLTRLDGNNYVVIRIRDQGEGMPKEMVNQIFDPFFSTRKDRNPMGLGLTVTKSFIDQWGGTIKVRSQEGQGSSFRIFLPQADKGATKQKKSRKPEADSTIVAVDNNSEELERIKHILTNDGLKVRTFTSGADAVEFYKKNSTKVSLVLLDLIMPEMDGKKLLTKVRAVNPEASVLVSSGFSRDYTKHYLDCKNWKFIQKPIESNLLIATVREIIKNNKERLKNPDKK